MITTCLIGVSGFANVHYGDILRQVARGQMRLLGATIINADEEPEKCRVLRELGCEIFTDHRAMLDTFAGRLDLCVIPTGLHLHAAMTLNALRAGANVLVEKPAAVTIQDVRAMQQAERAARRFVAVGFQNITARETLWMKRAILNGEIGALQCVKTRCLWSRGTAYYARNGWAGRLKIPFGNGQTWILDSPFNNAVSHQLNMIAFLAGTELNHSAEMESIEAELYRAHDIESPDTAALRAVTREGVQLLFLATHCPQNQLDPEIEVRGDKGRIHWTSERAIIERNDGSREEMPSESGPSLRDTLLDSVARRVHQPQTLVCDLDIAAAQTVCANGAHESSPVHPIDARFIRRETHGANVKTIIEGVDELIARAFEEEKLFSEVGAPWARCGQMVSLQGYDYFPRFDAQSLSETRGVARIP